MTFFQYKSFLCINCAIERIVANIIAKGQCPFSTIPNGTFWKRTPRGEEIARFFGEMTHHEKIEFIGFFDIFVVRYHNGINAVIEMTADSSSPIFERTLRVSISKGYKRFTERCSGRATPSIEGDLRVLIGDSQSPIQGISTDVSFSSGFPSVDRDYGLDTSPLLQGLSTRFGGGHANISYSPFQEHASNFSLFSSQPPVLGGNAMHKFNRMPVCSIFPVNPVVNPFTSNADFVPVQETSEPLRRQEQLRVVKGRVVRVEVNIPSDCSSGPSTSSTVGVGGIAKKSPRTQTPIATKIANLEKKISKLKGQNPREGSLDFLELQTLMAKLEKIRNSL